MVIDTIGFVIVKVIGEVTREESFEDVVAYRANICGKEFAGERRFLWLSFLEFVNKPYLVIFYGYHFFIILLVSAKR